MANVEPSITIINKNKNTVVYTWSGLGSGIVGDPVSRPELHSVIAHALGNFSGQTLTLQGSLNNVDWFTIVDTLGAAATWTVAGAKQFALANVPPYLRPSMSTGGTPAVNLLLAMSSNASTN